MPVSFPVFIECLQRELRVCPQVEVEDLLAKAPHHWHVVSIREPTHPEPQLQHALRSHAVVFSDVFTPEGDFDHGPRPAHLDGILRFVRHTGSGPLLLHCWAGRSRSTAVALVVIVKALWEQERDGADLVATAVDALLKTRPVATPNPFVLRLGLETFLPPPLVKTMAKALIEEPRIAQNFHAWRLSLIEEAADGRS